MSLLDVWSFLSLLSDLKGSSRGGPWCYSCTRLMKERWSTPSSSIFLGGDSPTSVCYSLLNYVMLSLSSSSFVQPCSSFMNRWFLELWIYDWSIIIITYSRFLKRSTAESLVFTDRLGNTVETVMDMHIYDMVDSWLCIVSWFMPMELYIFWHDRPWATLSMCFSVFVRFN